MIARNVFLLLSPFLLIACDNGLLQKTVPEIDEKPQYNAELMTLIQQVKNNLVFVEGGEFLMGDFGEEYVPEKINYDANEDSKPLHKVTLSSYFISKFKTTNKGCKLCLKLNNINLKGSDNFIIKS